LNLDFFVKLHTDPGFCESLGKVVLAAGRLESALRVYLGSHGTDVREGSATLGTLTKKLSELGLISRNGEMHFETLRIQRNYLTHKIYDLFAGHIEETILPRTDLVDLDILVFTDKASGLAEELSFFASLVEKRLSGSNEAAEENSGKSKLLV
jgi:hypothetical protein